MNYKQKKVMIIAGGNWQVPIIKKAKELGCFVINTNLYEDSIGFKYADVSAVADVIDKEKNLKIATKYKPDAIITDQSDVAVPTVAFLCEQLGLPGIGVEKAELFTNKLLMRQFCKENGFLYPKFRLCKDLDDVRRFSEETGFPFILKPINNQSSRGVNRVNSLEEIHKKYDDTLQHSKNNPILIEEFIGGIELTVEGFKTFNEHVSLAVSKKEHFQHNPAIASKLFYSESDENIDYQTLKKINNQLVNKMGLPFGITHAEYKYCNNKFYLIEIAARGGGTKISSHITPLLSGIDTNKLLIDFALGGGMDKLPEAKLIKPLFAVLEFFLFRSGIVKKIKGIEAIKEYKNVIDFDLNFKEGDFISEPKDDRSRAGYFIAYEKSQQALIKLSKEIKETLVLDYEK